MCYAPQEQKMKNKPSGMTYLAYCALIFILLLAPCTESVSAEDPAAADWTRCAEQNDCAAAFASAAGTEQLILKGRQAFEAGQPEQAGIIFERILLEQPWRLGVWLDYALSLQQMGNNDSARAIYQSLLKQNPPEHLVPWLKKQIQIMSPQSEDWQYAGAITLLTGHDSNLNRAPAASTLTLTMPSGTLLVLPLSGVSRASAGASQLARFDWQALRQGATAGDWLLQAAFNTRLSPDISGQNYLQSSIGLAHSWTSASSDNYHAILTAQNLRYNGQDIQRTLRAGLYQWQHGQTVGQADCSVSYGAEWEMLAYPSVTELNGQYFGVAADLGCKTDIAWQLLLRAGIDQAEHQRPGGDQQRAELRGQLGDRLGAGKWLALTELTWLRDKDGYNPLLDNNATRDIRHWLVKLEYQHPIGAGLHAVASAETFRQYSNLPLFAMRGKAAWIGVRYLF